MTVPALGREAILSLLSTRWVSHSTLNPTYLLNVFILRVGWVERFLRNPTFFLQGHNTRFWKPGSHLPDRFTLHPFLKIAR